MTRTMYSLIFGCALLAFSLCSCAKSPEEIVDGTIPQWEREILESPDKFEFLTLHPREDFKNKNGKYTFHGNFNGYPVMGRAVVAGKALQRTLLSQLYAAIGEGQLNVGSCLYPRHAIHVEKGGRHVDVLICFQCSTISVFPEGKKSMRINVEHLEAWKSAPAELKLPLHEGSEDQ